MKFIKTLAVCILGLILAFTLITGYSQEERFIIPEEPTNREQILNYWVIMDLAGIYLIIEYDLDLPYGDSKPDYWTGRTLYDQGPEVGLSTLGSKPFYYGVDRNGDNIIDPETELFVDMYRNGLSGDEMSFSEYDKL